MRLKESCRQSASVLTVSVLARPGTPSSNTCPPVMSPMSSRSIICFWPTITCPACAKSGSMTADSCCMRSVRSRMSVAGCADTGAFPPETEGAEANTKTAGLSEASPISGVVGGQLARPHRLVAPLGRDAAVLGEATVERALHAADRVQLGGDAPERQPAAAAARVPEAVVAHLPHGEHLGPPSVHSAV